MGCTAISVSSGLFLNWENNPCTPNDPEGLGFSAEILAELAIEIVNGFYADGDPTSVWSSFFGDTNSCGGGG